MHWPAQSVLKVKTGPLGPRLAKSRQRILAKVNLITILYHIISMTNAHTVNTQKSLYRISVSVTQRNSHAYCILAPPQPQPPTHIHIPPTPPPSNVLQKLTTLKNKTKQNKKAHKWTQFTTTFVSLVLVVALGLFCFWRSEHLGRAAHRDPPPSSPLTCL